ncbi:flagellar biosynthesis protein FliQ [Microbacterium aoyamense]|uniref:Flagellar biosynthetic protein FliQ n=1 Tax=Microbacterium aoyamense TaxID=344166 RepID=A0ABN2PDI9_9MICO|nr:flagellar biosynthesis protein FliQ [Microbacterium aoyamense]
MSPESVIDIGLASLLVAAKLCAPLLITALVVGFAVSLLQSITQVQEMTISFVPKLIAVGIALLVCGQWMIAEMIAFTHEIFARIPFLLGSG